MFHCGIEARDEKRNVPISPRFNHAREGISCPLRYSLSIYEEVNYSSLHSLFSLREA